MPKTSKKKESSSAAAKKATTASKDDDGDGGVGGASSSSSSAAAAAAAKGGSKKTTTVLDKIVHAIRSSPPGSNGGVSRVSIVKYLKSEFDYDNPSQIKNALKRGVTSGTLSQNGQSFAVAKDPPRVSDAASGQGLQIENIKEGKGEEKAERGDTVTVKYVGTLEDKTEFDSANSFEFLLGAGDVIKGWDQGVVGMAVGAKRKLVIPSHLGYGKRGCAPDIPPNATLYFDITMKKIVKG